MSVIQIYHGHVLDALRKIPDKSHHTAITSPPYYGLRRYPCPPQIWDADPKCDHRWGKPMVEVHRGAIGVESTLEGTEPAGRVTKVDHGAFCVYTDSLTCNAWRGQLGLEPTPELYIQHMLEIFMEVWRVLRDDGTLWVNIGDSYYNWRPGRKDHLRARGADAARPSKIIPDEGRRQNKLVGYKEKDLMGIPHMLKDALRNAGWYWRDEIIWRKPNKMPGSQRDRCTRNHEFIFMFTKRFRYYYDQVAIMEPVTGGANGHGENPVPFGWQTGDGSHRDIEGRYSPSRRRTGKSAMRGSTQVWRENEVPANREGRDMAEVGNLAQRIKRSVWTMIVRTQDVGQHTATFCSELPNEAIKAGSSERGCCPRCGKPWIRVTKKGEPLEEWKAASGADSTGAYHGEATKDYAAAMAEDPSEVKARILAGMREIVTIGWYPACRHYKVPKLPKPIRLPKTASAEAKLAAQEVLDAERESLCAAVERLETAPAKVLDIFGGVMTTAMEAARLQRDATMIELSDEYVVDGAARLRGEAPLLDKIIITPVEAP